jgi:hypothetical protein
VAKLKKNAMAQILFPLVDKVDFASLESGITSNITVKFYGVNHGVSAAMTSGTVSKTASVVRSGIFRQTLKAAETNYDHILYRITHASAADQLLVFETVDSDDSDTTSMLLLIQSLASDAHSAAAQANSRVLLNLSRVSDIASFLVAMSGVQSDIYSSLSDFYSDFQSRVPKRVATDSQLSNVHSDLRSLVSGITASVGASDISDIASAVWAHTIGARVDSRVLLNLSRLSDAQSLLSDFYSDFQSRVPKRVATDSQLSDVHSDLKSAIGNISVTLTASDISDIASAVVANLPGVSASDISDIASAVWAHTVGTRVDSRILVNQSRVSDAYSLLSDLYSDFQSRVPKRVATDSQVSDLHSDLLSYLAGMSDTLSNVYSGVTALSGAVSDTDSALTSRFSDLLSLLGTTGVALHASTMSDLRSAITAGGAASITASDISDIASAVYALLSSDLSDTLSAARQTNSRALVIQSQTSDIYSLLSDVNSDIGVLGSVVSDAHSAAAQANSRALVAQSNLSDIYSLLGDVTTVVGGLSDVLSDVYSLLSDFDSDFDSRFPASLPELSADPGANPTWQEAQMLTFMWLRNDSKSTQTKRLLRNNAGTTVLSATTARDNTSYVQGKLG